MLKKSDNKILVKIALAFIALFILTTAFVSVANINRSHAVMLQDISESLDSLDVVLVDPIVNMAIDFESLHSLCYAIEQTETSLQLLDKRYDNVISETQQELYRDLIESTNQLRWIMIGYYNQNVSLVQDNESFKRTMLPVELLLDEPTNCLTAGY